MLEKCISQKFIETDNSVFQQHEDEKCSNEYRFVSYFVIRLYLLDSLPHAV